MGVTTTEFPLLSAYGLYVSDTIGNGMSSPLVVFGGIHTDC